MARKTSPIVWSINPDLKIEVRYHQKHGSDNESLAFVWKTRRRQPTMRALNKAERARLLDLLLKLCRSAFK